MTAARLNWRWLLAYAAPGFALAMPTIPVYVYLPAFYADNLGLGLTVTGAVLLGARALDVVTDPLVGILSDRLRLPGGRRKPWIAAGALIAGVAMVMLFQPPATVGPLYLLGWAAALYLGWTMVAVPYTAWGAELSADYHERARITGGREAIMLTGVLAAGAIPAAAAAAGHSEQTGLVIIAWTAVLIGAPTIAVLLIRVPEPHIPSSGAGTRRGGWKGWRHLLANRPFLRLLGAWVLNGLANGIPAALFPLYLVHALEAEEAQRGMLIFVYFLSGVIAVPLWVRLSRQYGKHRVWCGAMALACAAFVCVPAIGPGDVTAFFMVCVVTGLALGADLALPPAMQADVVDLDTLRTRERRAGLYFAFWSMGTKLALAGAVGLAFPALDALGFDPGGENGAGGIMALVVIYSLVPVVFKLAAIAVVWRHPITERRQSVIRRRLDARAQRAAVGETV